MPLVAPGSRPPHRPCVAIVGPTAAGKSALGVAVACALSGEVVNTDSMQLYRGMDIGTAKISQKERDGVRHHMLDIWDVTQPASVAEYQRLARASIDDIRLRGRLPVLVGGSGLYVDAVLDRFEFPGTDAGLRARLEAELADAGPDPLYARLRAADPAAAAAILPSNGRRIVRALEVLALTGRGFAARLPEPVPHYPSVRLGLDLDTALLDERIAARVARMWHAGLVDEVRGLAARGLREGRTASRALGYRQVLRYLDGECDEPTAMAETVAATRRFVRRQRSWFRRDRRVRWLDATDPDLVPTALAVIRAAMADPPAAPPATAPHPAALPAAPEAAPPAASRRAAPEAAPPAASCPAAPEAASCPAEPAPPAAAHPAPAE